MALKFPQLILDVDNQILGGISLPETSNDRYQCYPAPLNVAVDMISGRRVIESRKFVQMIHYAYDYFDNYLWRRVLPVLRSGKPIAVQCLPDDSDEPLISKFLLESMSNPTFLFSENGVPRWHGVDFTLREERPHD